MTRSTTPGRVGWACTPAAAGVALYAAFTFIAPSPLGRQMAIYGVCVGLGCLLHAVVGSWRTADKVVINPEAARQLADQRRLTAQTSGPIVDRTAPADELMDAEPAFEPAYVHAVEEPRPVPGPVVAFGAPAPRHALPADNHSGGAHLEHPGSHSAGRTTACPRPDA